MTVLSPASLRRLNACRRRLAARAGDWTSP